MTGTALGRTLAVLLAALLLGGAAVAGPLTYGNPFDEYGRVPNTSCGAQQGICGAASAINSFVFLRNHYPKYYRNTDLTVGNQSGANANALAANDFAVHGWTENAVTYQGYYPRSRGVNLDYVDTLNDWLDSFAPSIHTEVSAMFPGNAGPGGNGNPTFEFLVGEMKDHEAVQLFIFNPAGRGHVLALVSISYAFDPAFGCVGTNCSITFQDPNDPNTLYTEIVTVSNGLLGLTMPLTFPSEFVTITAAFSQSPVSVPGSLPLFGLALVALVFARVRRA